MDIVTKLQVAALILGSIAFSTCLENNQDVKVKEIVVNPLSPTDKDSVAFMVEFVEINNVKSTVLLFKSNDEGFESVTMQPDVSKKLFFKTIPPLKPDSQVNYYLVIETYDGKVVFKPDGAPIVNKHLAVKKSSLD